MEDIKKIYPIIKPARKYLVIVSIFQVITSVIAIVWPYIIKKLIDQISIFVSSGQGIDKAFGILSIFAIALFSVSFIDNVVYVATGFYSVKLQSIIQKLVRTKLFSHLSYLSIDFFENIKIGKLISKISRGTKNSIDVLDELATWFLSQILNFFAVIIIFLYISLPLGILAVVMSVVYGFISFKMTKNLTPLHKKINQEQDKLGGKENEVLSGIHTVRLFAREQEEIVGFGHIANDLYDLNLIRAKKKTLYSVSRFVMVNTFRITSMLFVAYQVMNGKMTTGDIFLIYTYGNYLSWPLNNLAWMYDRIDEALKGVHDMVSILDQKNDIVDKENATELRNVKGKISFENITFGYKKENKVFKSISLGIEPGEIVALVGPSGVGKTTITKLIARLFDPEKGKILIDGNDLTDITQLSLRKNIGIVMQNVMLFNDTIKNNIRYGVPKANQEKVVDAAKAANIHNFILGLEKGYNTVIGERGIKLSGGEAQRIAIARAVLKNPPILILDEATSSLDSNSEKIVQDALWKLIKGRTTIIIAHRLATVMKADRILVLDKGKIIEDGDHHELIEKEGLYSKLFNIQSGAMLLTEKEVKLG